MTTSNSNGNTTHERILEWLTSKRSILAVTHERPDGDALGALFGISSALQTLNISCTPYVSEQVPGRYQSLTPSESIIGGAVDLSEYDALLCVDSANENRLALPKGVRFQDISLPSCNIDHHIDNSRYGEIYHIDADASAACEIIAYFLKSMSVKILPETATMLLTGIVSDTGCFRFDNTKPQTFRIAAWLVEHRADHSGVMRQLYFDEPIELLKLQAKIVEGARFALDNRLVYFFLTNELLSECGVDGKDTEDLIDTIRVIGGVDIVCRMQQVSDGVRFSLRSKDPRISVNAIAHELGGGGHLMAAGAYVKGMKLDEAERLLIEHAQKILFK